MIVFLNECILFILSRLMLSVYFYRLLSLIVRRRNFIHIFVDQFCQNSFGFGFFIAPAQNKNRVEQNIQ